MSTAKSKKANLEAMKINAMVNAELKRAFSNGVYAGTGKTLTLMCYILHNSFGFGEKRLKKIVKEGSYLAKCTDEGRLSIDDMTEVLKNECNFSIEELVDDDDNAEVE